MKHRHLFRREFGTELPPEAVDRLACHAELLERWNRVVRLVGEAEPGEWIRRHYAESIAARAYWRASTAGGSGEPGLLDIGSGAGFPGLVLAALHPERPVTLVEARERKAAFLAEAARELGLPNVRVVRERFDADLALRLGGAVECATIRGLRLPEPTMARLVEALPDEGRLVVWAGRRLATGLSDTCAVEQEMRLPDSPHRRILCLRPLRRG
ncbi:MAG: class I SAM-dependent methyltransferase [Acidobacteriota bacterium]|nr:class I SAM-dependent methyltransferase [Acidobacteriota bacterium]